MEELIDVLNEKGAKTGQILTKNEVHRYGLCHRIIVVAIIDKNGSILMQKRSKTKEANPEKWDVSTAGHVSSGQTSIEASIREAWEELGIKIEEKELKHILTYKDTEKIKENYIDNQIYDCYIVNKEQIKIEDIKIQKSELEQVKLCNLEQFKNIIENKNAMNREELYKEIIKYLK